MKRTLVFAMAGLDWMPVAHAQVPAGENVMKPAAVVAVAHFVAADVIDYAKVLPMPPAAGSLAAAADLAAVRQAQAWRTEGQVAWAKLVEKDVVFNHAAVVGVWFAAERLPLTAAFFQRLGEDLRAVDGAAKKPFLRARPTTVDAGVVPCVTLPASTSYPSGSAMQSWMWAELLAEALPAERDALRVRAQRVGRGGGR
ncbi:MAG: hypothetical protein NTV51_07675 [Verrucomicrobia bacterium]|nr:hypothetical protein [Verrucomicrobiota bacterium]